MRSHRTLVVFTAAVSIAVSIAVLVAPAPPARAAETPRRGGVLLAAIAADAPSLDPHQEETFATLELVAPCYSTLLQIDPYHYPKVIGDVATEWKIAADGLTYTFKLRQGIRFHDGSPLTAADVKTTTKGSCFRRRASAASARTPMSRSRASRLPMRTPSCSSSSTHPRHSWPTWPRRGT